MKMMQSAGTEDMNEQDAPYEKTVMEENKEIDPRLTEESVNKPEEKYRSLFENLPDGYAYCKMLYTDGQPQDFTYLEVNPAFEELTGLRDVVGRKVSEVIPGLIDSNRELFETYARVASTGRPERFETYLEPLGIWLLITAYSGQKDFFIAVFQNITDRKKIEQELAYSRQMLQIVLDNIPQGVFWKDKDSNYLGCNKAHARTFHLECPGLINGKNDFQFYKNEFAELYRSEDRQIMSTGKPMLSFEEIGQLPDDSQVLYRTSKVPLRDIDGRVFGVLGIYEDITEYKRLEEALRRSAERLAGINRVDRVITSSLDLDTVYEAFIDEMRRLVHFDCTSIVEFDEEGARWRITHQWIDGATTYPVESWRPLENSAPGWVAEHRQAFLGDSPGEEERRLDGAQPCLDGLQSRVLLPLFHHEQVIGLLTLASRQVNEYAENDLGMLQSMADQLAIALLNAKLYKQTQQWASELEQRVTDRTAQLEKANQNLQTFTYSVSHDLRAPLRAITGFSQILVDQHCANLDEEGRHFLDNILEASNRMGVLIEDLLRYTRIGFSGVRHTQVSLSEVLGRVLDDLNERILQSGACIELPAAHDLGLVTSDRTLLSQIFKNLIENALIYQKTGAAPQIKITCRKYRKSLVLGVSDNGIGIIPEYQEKIFNVFQRLHSDDDYPGTGIGLAIVKKAVDLLGGQVWLESTVDQGSAFWLRLPRE
jgi:PAS domain S-box-containing protein